MRFGIVSGFPLSLSDREALLGTVSRVKSTLSAKNVLFPCPACGASHVLDRDTHVVRCRVWGHVIRFYQCKACRTTFSGQYGPSPEGSLGDHYAQGPDRATEHLEGSPATVPRALSLERDREVGNQVFFRLNTH